MRNVAALVADDVHVLEQSRNQVEPALVVVHPLGHVVPAVGLQPVGPPAQELARRLAFRDTDEPAVVDTRLEDVELTRAPVGA